MNWDTMLWLIALVVFFLAEASTVTVVSLWFAAGSLVALFASLLDAPLWLQGLLFLVVSVALLLALRPIIRKHFKPKITRTNVDAIIGTEGIVTVPIDNIQATGTVKLGGMEWSARSYGNCRIDAGTRIKVDKVEGVKVYVTPIHVEETIF